MHTHQSPRERPRGNSATPLIVFIGIVVLSVIFFFALTLPRQLERKRQAQETVEPAAPTPAIPAPEPSKSDSNTGSPPAPAPEPPPVRHSSPRHFVQAIADSLSAGDVKSASALIGPEALSGGKAAFFEAVFGAAPLRPRPESPLREIGDVGELYRWAIRLHEAPGAAIAQGDPAAASPRAPADELALEIDVTRATERGWMAKAVHFSPALRAYMSGRGGAPGIVPADLADEDKNDPLKIAAQFLTAVLEQNYARARSVTDTANVTREKVAGLCILFEEGDYRVADHRPLSATAAGSDSAWVIVRVHSARDGHDSDFGIELKKTADGTWQVGGLNFSKLLETYVTVAGSTGGAAYTPLVKNPQGGESLVVYFDFDQSGLVPRAQRQLEIVANLLRDDPNRKIRLSGHADAVGSESYNLRLSSARAFEVKTALIRLGVAGEQIITEGFGDLRPLDPNTLPGGADNPEGRSRNRRTEIFLDF